jgi:hypothetical protein
MAELSEVFYSLLITSVIGLILASLRMCYKSKCRVVQLGCIRIERDVEGEEKLDLQIPQTPKNDN